MHDFPTQFLRVIILVFLFSTLPGAGSDLTLRQILELLRNGRPVVLSLTTSFLSVPLTAIIDCDKEVSG